MRSFLACALMISALSAGGVQAAEAAGRVSVESREGQAIVRKVVGLSERLGLPNPFVAAEPEPALSAGDKRAAELVGWKNMPKTAGDRWREQTRLEGRQDTVQYPTHLAKGAQEKLRTKRVELLGQLDLDAKTRARMGEN